MIYVDDIIIISDELKNIKSVKEEISACLDAKDMGELSTFLGVTYSPVIGGAMLDQESYVLDVLERFGMEKCKPVSSPMTSGCSSVCSNRLFDQRKYEEVLGCLLFLATRTRPDINIAVTVLCWKSFEPLDCDFIAAKRVLRYLQGTRNFGLKFSGCSGSLRAFADGDWAGDEQWLKSTTGFVIFLGNSAVPWKSAMQTVVALLTSEAEFIAASEVCKVVM
ncbi:putative mitochondrial protein [Gracilariopsis chorda]|uniref:Putative mitochondrial protein n=1 Tax=Gracilariopsis chorda TaxID=448386 RepID=A0A2V3IUY1_9FLOR|nr:putative mitochondrial protein [Gracilariopsis chorda]|eukprot:PXF45923.1 putative mitochondrial protein [Gracilariopsis chorda]